jgi:hypothetical protein
MALPPSLSSYCSPFFLLLPPSPVAFLRIQQGALLCECPLTFVGVQIIPAVYQYMGRRVGDGEWVMKGEWAMKGELVRKEW